MTHSCILIEASKQHANVGPVFLLLNYLNMIINIGKSDTYLAT